jgi:hypothetical protein
MKLTVALLALAIAISLSSDASAKRIRSCKELQAMCVAKAWGNASQCGMLYDSAVKEGGVWMSSAARIAAKVPAGGSGSCGVD